MAWWNSGSDSIIDLFGSAPRIEHGAASTPSASRSLKGLTVTIVAVLAYVVVAEAYPADSGSTLGRWLLVVGTTGPLLLLARFCAQAWQFREDDWVPIGGSALLGLLLAFNTWQVLAGRQRSVSVSHLRVNFSAAPLRWLEYSPWIGFSWIVVALAITGGGFWLARSIPHYWRRKNKAAVIVVTAASIGCCAITWMIVR